MTRQTSITNISIYLGLALHNVHVYGVSGDVELELPEGTPDFDPDRNRIRPSAGEPDEDTWISNSRRTTFEGGLPTVPEGNLDQRTSNGSIKLLSDLAPQQLAAAQQEQQKGLQVPTLCTHHFLSVCLLFLSVLSCNTQFVKAQVQTSTFSSSVQRYDNYNRPASLFSCKSLLYHCPMVPGIQVPFKRCLGVVLFHACGDVYL